MNKCILARIYKNCKAQCGQYRIQKESMWVNIKWRIILICEESIPARNWTRNLLHPRAEGLPVALTENSYRCAILFPLVSLSWGSKKLKCPQNLQRDSPTHQTLINFQKYKCLYVVRNNLTKIITALKE